ncbi:DUF4278 domain-containing protein [Lyngbya sp. CCY1209]|jgi:hypothetical protein|uniref:DUF4278 domain-containing protein n=1 Tax=Lyngbya sp. CCY1209 TaxID=2886103 RepID=UPI002D211035|nr:DUF4278 domain-containing protein [Lyngbya sp. CCY1209]MEB3885667.1 DUF4278 domain-containing protein [Lyngbya sp. CCY1209]
MQLTYRGLPYIVPSASTQVASQSTYKYRGITYKSRHGVEAIAPSDRSFKYRGVAYQNREQMIGQEKIDNLELFLSLI